MRMTERLQNGIIDLVGAAVITACAVVFFWCMCAGSDRTRTELAQLKRSIAAAVRDMDTLETANAQQQTILAQHRSDLSLSGQVPEHAPVEEYFRFIAAKATEHGLRMIRHNPVPPRSYPGLLEQRYQVEVSGPTRGLIRFLEAIERTEFWADVSYLKIEAGSRPIGSRAADSAARRESRRAALTISLFSAPQEEPPSGSGEDA